MTKREIQARLGDIAAESAVMENDESQLESLESLLEEAENLQAELVDIEAKEARQARAREQLASLEQFRQAVPTPRSQSRNGPVAVQVAEPEWMRDPAVGFANHRAFLMAVMQVETHGIESDQLRFLKYAAAGTDEHSGLSDPYGGYAIPTAFSPQLLSVGFEGDPTAGRTQDVPMTSPRVEVPARVDKDHRDSVTGGFRVYRRAETQTANATRGEMEKIGLTAHPLMGISFSSEELLTDSPLSFVAIIERGFREEFGSKLFDEKLGGTGVGEYLGVLNSPALVTVARGGANQIAYTDVVALRARIWRYQGAIWLANHDTIPQLMTMELSTGSGVVWQPTIREDMPDMLLGRPIFFTEYVPALGTTGDLLLCNWGEYLEGVYQQVQGQESIHVRFLNNERTFRFTQRSDGQPWWRTSLTPRRGANNLSPFVTLTDP